MNSVIKTVLKDLEGVWYSRNWHFRSGLSFTCDGSSMLSLFNDDNGELRSNWSVPIFLIKNLFWMFNRLSKAKFALSTSKLSNLTL